MGLRNKITKVKISKLSSKSRTQEIYCDTLHVLCTFVSLQIHLVAIQCHYFAIPAYSLSIFHEARLFSASLEVNSPIFRCFR